MKEEEKKKKGRLISGFNFAIDGLIYSITKEYNMKFHLVTAIIVLFITMLFNISKIELALLALTITLVFVTELINTAVERCVDLATKEYDPIAKIAKDVAAGAVLVSAINAVLMGYLIFFDKFIHFSQNVFLKIRKSSTHLTVIIIVLVLLITVLLKSIFYKGRGTHVQGGAVSGHASLSFAIATIIGFLTNSGIVIILSYILAFLVAESRVEGKIHATSEVIMGAILGIALTVLVFKLMM